MNMEIYCPPTPWNNTSIPYQNNIVLYVTTSHIRTKHYPLQRTTNEISDNLYAIIKSVHQQNRLFNSCRLPHATSRASRHPETHLNTADLRTQLTDLVDFLDLNTSTGTITTLTKEQYHIQWNLTHLLLNELPELKKSLKRIANLF